MPGRLWHFGTPHLDLKSAHLVLVRVWLRFTFTVEDVASRQLGVGKHCFNPGAVPGVAPLPRQVLSVLARTDRNVGNFGSTL